MTETALAALEEPCQWCGLPIPLADLMFCPCGCGLTCADRITCNARIDRRIARLKVTSAMLVSRARLQ